MIGAFFNWGKQKVSICMPGPATPRWMPVYKDNVIAQVCESVWTPHAESVLETMKVFFPSGVADIALKARSLHEHKLKERCLYKDITCPNEQANQSKTTHKPQKTNTHKTTRKSPSQTCVSPAETAKQTAKHQKHTKKRGRSPNKTPTKSICQGMQWLFQNVPMN